MTVQKSLKRRVRSRMAKTGERYAAARRSVLGATPPDVAETAAIVEPEPVAPPAESPAPQPTADPAVFGMSSEAMQRKTGKGWDEWLAVLDAWGAADRSHPEIASYVRDELGVDGWWAQNITVGYERARGKRAVGQLTDGFATNASKTVAVPVDRLYEAFVDPDLRARWLPDAPIEITTARPGKSVRAAWAQDGGHPARVDVEFSAKGPGKSSAAIQLRRLPDAASAERMKTYLRERLAVLADLLQGESQA